jgi:WbqC-like protein family
VATCVITQPRLFPGLHFLHRMMVADVFVIFDTVQFNPRHEENRAKLKTARGGEWLTVPMRQLNREQLILDTTIDNTQPWQRKAWGTIQSNYAKAPGFEKNAPAIRAILETPHATLLDLDRASWEPALRLLGITCRFVRASELPVSGKGPQLLLDICKQIGADTYLSGGFGREYLDPASFAREGIEVLFHRYEPLVYPQRHGDFLPYLSYLDVLFNVDLDRDFLLAGGSMGHASVEGVAS